jgi:hypothetical protein
MVGCSVVPGRVAGLQPSASFVGHEHEYGHEEEYEHGHEEEYERNGLGGGVAGRLGKGGLGGGQARDGDAKR